MQRLITGTGLLSPRFSPNFSCFREEAECSGQLQRVERRDSNVYGSVGWRYPSLLIPMQMEGELSTRLAQSAEDTGVDENEATY